MADPLPAPGLSGDVPRCVATCPLWSRTPSWRYGNCVDPAQGRHRVIGDLCTPYVRHLKLLSERRCDGCVRYTAVHPMCGECPLRKGFVNAAGHCETWEKKP